MTLGTDNATALTTEQVAAMLTEPLEQVSTFLASGPRSFDTAGALRIPRFPAYTDATSWYGENEEISDVTPDLTDELVLLPETVGSVKTLTRYSNELARQSVTNLEAVLRERLVRDVATKIDKQAYSDDDGITASKRVRPVGMFAWDGTQSSDLTGKPLDIAAILDGQGKALEAGITPDALRLYIRPGDLQALRAETDGNSRYQLEPDPTLGGIPTILGMPVTVSAHIPEGYAAIADPSQIAVARDVAQSVAVLSETFGQYDQQALRVVSRFDWAPLNSDAVVILSGFDS